VTATGSDRHLHTLFELHVWGLYFRAATAGFRADPICFLSEKGNECNTVNLDATALRVSDISFGRVGDRARMRAGVSDTKSLTALAEDRRLRSKFLSIPPTCMAMAAANAWLLNLRRGRKDEIVVATKAGRRLPRQTVEGYSRQNLTTWVEDSLRNLSTDSLDLLQLHCPPSTLYDRPEVFGILDDLVRAGKIRYYGVSVEKIEEAIKAVEFPNVQTVQIIFNCFRQRPADQFFARAQQKRVGILARVPLASGFADGQIPSRFDLRGRRSPEFQSPGASF